MLRTLHEGFVDNERKICAFTDHQIFERFHKYTLKSDRVRSGKLALSLKELSQIEVGDFIVHVDHGVGRFGGLVRTAVNGKMQEMIKLTYLNDDKIFVSIHSLHKLAKYRGKEGVPPKLNKLGSGAWNRVKERTKSKLKDIARDLSAINTPPRNRYPIITNVTALDDEILREAINFELARGGQVFIVNNRIEQLFDLESRVRRLVPDARTVVGHGQMASDKLEQTIIDFAAHQYDVLLATTIIESGIDMPNVNTIIINNAQNFGLSELHQLRGRVGRSNRKAFCYLLVPPEAALTPVARRRLQAIESFSDLGSGIHIAMQDLDIRGAGNLLGAEQSGFIADLGYETYQKILKEAVLELKTEEFADTFADEHQDSANAEYANDCTIESDLEILFPASYVPQESERILLYQELDNMERQEDVDAFCKRLEDRFGAIPDQARELILVVTLRRLARRLGIEKIVLKQGHMTMFFVSSENAAYYQSPAFGRILTYLQQNVRIANLNEHNNRRSMRIDSIKTVREATDVVRHILDLPVCD